MTVNPTHRSTERTASILFRLSHEDRTELKRRASDAGLSVQAYMEMKALDRYEVTERRSGPTTGDGQGVLDLAM